MTSVVRIQRQGTVKDVGLRALATVPATEIPLPPYQPRQPPRAADTGLVRTVLEGLSCRRDAACAEAVPAAFGLRPSTGSRRVLRASATTRRARGERRLEGDDVVALLLDGTTVAEDAILIALGIPLTGETVLLGCVQTATEDAPVSATVPRALVARGLRAAPGLLVVLDGATGLRKALQTVVGAQALVQRCQWHTRENVIRYLPQGQQAPWRQTLQAAYERPTDAEATAALLRLRREVTLVNESAVRRLDDGLEATLTLHRLGLFGPLGISLTTTNCLESLTAQLGAYTATVDRWRTSDQKPRWVASALLTIEPCLRRIKGYRHLPLLRAALQREIASSTQRHERVA